MTDDQLKIADLERRIESLERITPREKELPPLPPAPPPQPVDRSARTLLDGSPVTEDHREIDPVTGMQKSYVVLSQAERAKGFVRPVRDFYRHKTCGTVTSMGKDLAETYARDPGFYDSTFSAGPNCRAHYPLNEFIWEGTNEQVGS